MSEMEYRLVRVKEGKQWTEVKLSEIKEGDKFRMWEPDGTIVRTNNKYVFTAKTDATIVTDDSGAECWGIEIED